LVFGLSFRQNLNEDNIPKNIIHISIINKNYISDNIKNNKIIGILYNDFNIRFFTKKKFIKYDNNLIFEEKILLDEYISKNLTEEKLIGNIIQKELIEKVFDPKRLLRISNTYNIPFSNLLNFY